MRRVVFDYVSSIMRQKVLVIEWLSWLTNNGSYINYNFLKILGDIPNISSSFKFMEERVDELVREGRVL